MENNNDIDDLFKDIVEPNEMNHSDKVWASLDGHLEKKSSKRDKAIIFRLRIAVGVLLFLFGSSIFYYFFSSKETNSESLKTFPKTENLRPALPFEVNNSTSIRNIDKSASNKENFQPKNTFFTKSNANLNQTQKQSSADNSKKSNLIADNKSNSLSTFSNTSREIGGNNSFNKATASTEIENNSNGTQFIDSIITNSIGTPAAVTAVKDGGNSTIKEVNHTEKPKITTTACSKEKLDSLQKNHFKTRLSVMAYFSPDFTLNYLKDNDKTDNENEGDYNSNEVPDFSCNTGILLGYDVSKNWSLKFGGTYAYLSQTIKPKTVYAKTGTDGLAHYQFKTAYGASELPRDQSSPPFVGDSININSNSIQSLQIIGIPLISKYQITKNKFSYYAQLGVSFNFLIGDKLYVETPNKPTSMSKLEGLNEYYFGGIFGLGVSYSPIKKLSILLEPTIKGAITPINNNTPITTRPISFGLALGLGWHF